MRSLLYRVKTNVADIWEFDSPAWAELLLASIKCAFGTTYILSASSAALIQRYGASWPAVAASIGGALVLFGALQLAGVLLMKPVLRKFCLTVGVFFWLFYGIASFLSSGMAQGLIVFLPLIGFNILALRRLVSGVGRPS